ncbi:unnamed protein product [Victoria cruziana]
MMFWCGWGVLNSLKFHSSLPHGVSNSVVERSMLEHQSRAWELSGVHLLPIGCNLLHTAGCLSALML